MVKAGTVNDRKKYYGSSTPVLAGLVFRVRSRRIVALSLLAHADLPLITECFTRVLSFVEADTRACSTE
jgi:hypothetical protein